MRKFILFIVAVLTLCAIASCTNKHAPSEGQILSKGERLDQLTKSKAWVETDTNFLGVKPVPLGQHQSPILETRITLRSTGTIGDVVNTVLSLVPVTINLADDVDASDKAPAGKETVLHTPPQAPVQPQGNSDPDIAALLAEGSSSARSGGIGPSRRLDINYEGPLKGLLDQISAQSGYGWDYNNSTKTITFAHMIVRTFPLIAAPSDISYENTITNKSKEGSNSSISSGSVGSTVTTQDTQSQTNQSTATKYKYDVWKDTAAAIKNLLSSKGKVAINQAAGTITVTDRPENVRKVGAYIENINSRLERQVAVRVNIYSLELTDDSEAGVNLQVLFNNENVSVAAGSLSGIGLIDTAGATLVTGKLRNSGAILKALKEWGNARVVTSGAAVAMNNSPTPLLNEISQPYVAGSKIQTTDYGSSTEITPGEVKPGFAMTIVPNILENRKVVLNYSFNMSALLEMASFTLGNLTVQQPKMSRKAVNQRIMMQMGQTLVLAGFAQSSQQENSGMGFIHASRKAGFTRTLLVITIEVENASPEMGIEG